MCLSFFFIHHYVWRIKRCQRNNLHKLPRKSEHIFSSHNTAAVYALGEKTSGPGEWCILDHWRVNSSSYVTLLQIMTLTGERINRFLEVVLSHSSLFGVFKVQRTREIIVFCFTYVCWPINNFDAFYLTFIQQGWSKIVSIFLTDVKQQAYITSIFFILFFISKWKYYASAVRFLVK